MIKVRESSICCAYVSMDDKRYLMIHGPIMYICTETDFGYRDDVEISEKHMDELRVIGKDLWDVLF